LKTILNLFVLIITSITAGKANSPEERSLLWEISGNGLKKPSYIFGTIHIISKKDFVLKEKVLRSMERSEKLVMEMVIDPSYYQKILTEMIIKEDLTIDSLLSPDDLKLLESFASDSIHMGMFMFKKMKPIFIQQTLSTISFGKDVASYELKLAELFKEQEKPVVGLESFDFQLSMLNQVPYKDQAKMLMEFVKNYSGSRKELDSLVEAYKREDLNALSGSIEKSDLAGFASVLLDSRNERWIPKIEKLMEEAPVFIAVGAAHLGGEKGVLNLLRKKGYTVKAQL
jgi:uncharacterized protein